MLPLYLLLLYLGLYRRFVRPAYRRWRELRLRSTKRRVVLLWQYPVAGKVKKNWIPKLGAVGAAQMQLCVYNYTLNLLAPLQVCTPPAATCTEVCYQGAEDEAVYYWLGRRQPSVVWRPQSLGDQSFKLATAIAGAFSEGVEYVLVVIKDAVSLTEPVIREAFDKLARGSDLVMVPTHSGGYCCIGFTKRSEPHLPYMFLGLEWDSERLLNHQCLIADRIGLKYTILPEKLTVLKSLSDLSLFEQVSGGSKEDVLNPRWTAVVALPLSSTPEQIEESVMQLVERCDFPEKIAITIIGKRWSNNTLGEKVKVFGVKLKVEGSFSTCPSHGNVLFIPLGTALPLHWDTIAHYHLTQPGVEAGAFRFGMDIIHNPKERLKASVLHKVQAKSLEWFTNILSKHFEMPQPEQGLFMSFSSAGHIMGFSSEDAVDQTYLKTLQKIATLGHITTADGEPCIISSYRFNFKVFFKRLFIYIFHSIKFKTS